MPNKIKEIFSDDMFNIDGHLNFKDDEAYKNFLTALEIAYAEGRAVPVEGVTSITTEVRHQGLAFPLTESTNISDLIIGPVEEPITIPLKVGTDEKTITLLRTRIKDKAILKSKPDSIVFFQFVFLYGENKHTVNYKVQFEKAKNIEEVADSFDIADALLATLYKPEAGKQVDNNKVSLSDVKKYFHYYAAFFRRLLAIEKTLGLSLSPALLNKLSREEQQGIDELYLLLCNKQVVRLDAKLTSTDLSEINMKSPDKSLSVGSEIKLTFLNAIEFSFLERTVMLHTANLMMNAVVKKVQKNSDGTIKILYGDTDSKPMYIAFSAFKTEDEAAHEVDCIMDHEKDYVEALTSNEYIKQFYYDE